MAELVCTITLDEPWQYHTVTGVVTGQTESTVGIWYRSRTALRSTVISTHPYYIGLFAAMSTVSVLCRAASTYSDRSAPSVDLSHPRSSVTCCVLSIVVTQLQLRSTRRFAYPRTEQTSISPECWCVAHFFRQTSMITFHRYYVTFTACGRRCESTTRLPFSCIGVYTDLLRHTRLSARRSFMQLFVNFQVQNERLSDRYCIGTDTGCIVSNRIGYFCIRENLILRASLQVQQLLTGRITQQIKGHSRPHWCVPVLSVLY